MTTEPTLPMTNAPASPRLPKIALVTGAAKRIGREIALALADAGWDICVHYSSSAVDAAETVSAIQARGRRAVALPAELGNETEVRSLFARSVEQLGLPTCIVNNASRFDYDDAHSFAHAQLDAHMRINLAAPVLLAQCLYAALTGASAQQAARDAVAETPAVVINLLDQKLFNYNPDFLSYTLSKAALQAATVMLAQALAPHVRVVGLAPGITLLSGEQSAGGFAAAHGKTPLGRSSTPADIARSVCFIADMPALTGTTLLVDGGQHLLPTERDIMFLT